MGSQTDTGLGADESADEQGRAFVVVRHGERTWVRDLPLDVPVALGADPKAGAALQELGDSSAGTLAWDGTRLSLAPNGGAPVFLNGKRLEEASDLKPGDEIGVGKAQLVVGVANPSTTGVRRALTHHEFRERLYEEMARAGRGGRPTALLMMIARAGEGGRVATVALESLRAGDVVGTYAQDELEVLMPDTAGATAHAVIDRIFGATGLAITVGLAVAPEDGDNPERLTRAVRLAIARARRGRGFATPPPKVPIQVQVTVHDPATRELVTALEQAAGTDEPVLLTGELSSGKGAFARMLHDHGPRGGAPFVVVACPSLRSDEEARDAFTSELVERVRGGTLLVDEVGDLPAAGQEALLALLEQHGEALRVVTTTHRALVGLVERGAFDQPLYERLASGTVLEVPALRARPEDIIPLAERFAVELGASEPVRMSPGAMARLRSYPWPGNVLELCNAMDRAVRLSGGGEILAEHLPSEILPAVHGEGRLREHVDSVERDAIVKALADSNHNQTHAARRLGISRRALIYKMEKYGLKPPPGTVRRGVG